jgi:hypothetical protein
VVGATLTLTGEAAVLMVMEALADAMAFATEVAVSVTTGGLGAVAGAV